MPVPDPAPSLSRRRFLTLAAGGGAALSVTRLSGAHSAPEIARVRQPSHPARGLHLSLTGDARTTRTVTWFTDGQVDPGSVVRWATGRPGRLDRMPSAQTAVGTSSVIPGVDGLVHRATMTSLPEGAEVRYQVGGEGGFSPEHVLGMPSLDDGFGFAHLGDHGTEPTSRGTTAAIEESGADLVLVAGDLSYANGVQPVWDTWFGQIEPLVSAVPMMAAPGNHENKDFGGETFKQRLSQPGRGSFYGFDMGRVHISVGTAGVFLADGTLAEELLFLEQDLAAAAARRALGELDFVVAVQHYPIWTDHESRGPLNPSLVLVQEQIFQRYQIDLLLVGHDHFYERSVPMAYGQPAPAGYVQVISGGGGKSLYDFVPDDAFQSWSAAHAKRFHLVYYEVTRSAIHARALATDGTGDVLDEFVVPRRPLVSLVAARPRPATEVLGDVGSITEANRAGRNGGS